MEITYLLTSSRTAPTLPAVKFSLLVFLAGTTFCASLSFAAPVKEGGVYDPEGHLITYLYADGTKDSYIYDLKGQMVQFTSKHGEVTRFIYELNGSIVSLLADGRKIITPPKSKK